MTEDEAKTKWCCGPPGTGQPITGSSDLSPQAARSCIGSMCMAWRWSVTVWAGEGNGPPQRSMARLLRSGGSVGMIVIYQALDISLGSTFSAAPEHMRFCASLQPDDRAVPCWTAHGPTPEAAEAKLRSFWETETAKAQNIANRGKHLRKRANDPLAPVDDIGAII